MSEREFDVVVFGASGLTGRQVAAYLAQRSAETGARWAAAARNPAKLADVLDQAGVSPPATIVADLNDKGSLAAMAARTAVVLNLVGPYTLYGRPVIEACVSGGAHYADLTGEIPFVREMIDAFHLRAEEAGVKVIEVCGFESLPPDLGVLLAAQAARERWEEGLAEVEVEVTIERPPGLPRPSDALSGGTLQSLAAAAGDDNTTAITDPAALVTDPAFAAEVRRRSPISIAPRRGPDGTVIAPMAPAAFINPAVIHRTAALLADEVGRAPFRYREGIALAGGPASLPFRAAAAGALAATQAGISAVTRARPSVRRRVSRTLTKVLPASGFGPAADRLEGWRWRMSIAARTTGGRDLHVVIDGDGHPGYLTTAAMLGEAGLLLAEPGLTPKRAGCLTPAAGLGTASIERFERARLRFAVSG